MKTKYLIIFLIVGLTFGPAFGVKADKAQKGNDVVATNQNESKKPTSKESEKSNDLWLKSKLITTYTLNEHLNSFEIDVTVEDGVVTLSGIVESNIEKELAEEIARGVEGVRELENKISVEPESESRREDTGFSRAVEDASTTARVKYNLLWNRNTSGMDIKVNTINGTVTLTGLIGSKIEKELAIQIAKNTKGVLDVIDRLEVSDKEVAEDQKSILQKTGRFMSDAWITSKVKTVFLFSKNTEGSEITVSTQEGVVTLEGSVKSEKQKQQVIQLAKEVVNVKSVQSNLTIEK
jgi:hyperosmotically inducible periplasmic protein